MTGAHWLILAAAAVAAVLCLWWTRRRPRVWRQEEVDEIRRRARERSEQTRQWVDEPGDPTHEQIDQALDLASEDCCEWHNRNCEPPSELCCEECTEVDHPLHRRRTDCIAPDLSATVVDKAKADHLNAAMRAVEHPWTHLTAEEGT